MFKNFNGVKLKNCGAPVKDADIDAELTRKFNGSDCFYEFYKTYNGGYANKNTTRYGYIVQIINFFYIKNTPDDLFATIKHETKRFRTAFKQEKIFDDAIIFTTDQGYNPIYIDLTSGEIFFTAVDDGLYERILLGKDFEHFLRNLEFPTRVWAEEDPTEVPLVEGYETWWNELE